MNPNALLPREVAERWGCSEQHVRNMVNRGDLAHYRLGGKLLRIPLSAVEDVECATKATPTKSDGSSRPSSRRENASSRSGQMEHAVASGSVPLTRLKLADLRQRSTQRP